MKTGVWLHWSALATQGMEYRRSVKAVWRLYLILDNIISILINQLVAINLLLL